MGGRLRFSFSLHLCSTVIVFPRLSKGAEVDGNVTRRPPAGFSHRQPKKADIVYLYASMSDLKARLRVLVTGGTGFVGSFIVNALLEKHPDWEVIILDLIIPDLPKENVKYEKGSVTEMAALESVFERIKPNVVVHTAGIVPELAKRYTREDERRVYHVNVTGTQNMLQVAKEHGAEAFVWTGSCTAVIDDMRREYRNIDESVPTSTNSLIYGESKVSYCDVVA